MATPKRIGAIRNVAGPNGREVRVGFWDDGSILITIPHIGQMAISQFFTGRANQWTNIRVVPLPYPSPGVSGEERGS